MNLGNRPDPANIHLSRAYLHAEQPSPKPRPPKPITYTWWSKPRAFTLPDSPLPLMLLTIGGAMALLWWTFTRLVKS